MTKDDTDFETWFEAVQMLLGDAGISFHDKDSVRDDYDKGKDEFDVVDEIKAEYGEAD